jgi:very-short-patch-repair endonuclease
MYQCKYCNSEFNKKQQLGGHIIHCDKNPHKYFFSYNHKRKISESNSGNKNYWYGKHLSKETKQKISKKLKEYIKQNIKNRFPNPKKETKPEKRFREIAQKTNIRFYQYYIPQDNDRLYELDFAIPELKIGFEINGNFHYDKSGELLEYYRNRHNYFEKRGWVIIEIPYYLCFNEKFILKTINDTISSKNHIVLEKEIQQIINHRIERKNNKIKEREIKKSSCIKIREEIKINQINYIIDFINKNKQLKWGSITKIAEDLNISHTQVSRLIKMHNLRTFDVNGATY